MIRNYGNRQYIIGGFFLLIGLIFIVRLFSIQVIDDTYKTSSENNVIRKQIEYPGRGLIYDRNKTLLVYNEASYDLMVTPREAKNIDTTLLCKILNIDTIEVKKRLIKCKKYSSYKSSVFMKQISTETYASLSEKMFQLPGFYVQSRTVRKYPKKIGAHILGYVGEVNNQIIKRNKYYKKGDYIGVTGVEKAYEEKIRGTKGIQLLLKDVHNNIKGSFQKGQFDIPSVKGKDITTTIDVKIQEYGEKLMIGKRGSIVAIEPTSGEILCLISSPSYDPNLLVGRKRNKNYKLLNEDSINKPLFNRAVLAQYPPGSTFKLLNALVALEEKTINQNINFYCNKGFDFGVENRKMGCHLHRSPLNLEEAISASCNTYFCYLYKGFMEKNNNIYKQYNKWHDHISSFGLGNWLNNDLPTGRKGFVPKTSYYDKMYKKGGWKALTNISLAVGQDALLITPIQMANMTAAIANRGFYYTPHIIKKIEDDTIASRFKQQKNTSIKPKNFEIVINGMKNAIEDNEIGTSNNIKIKDITVCGKTGTAENPHGEDHSIFIAFAPEKEPKIAIAVYIENGGWGSTWAAPIASLVIEKYLNNKISRPKLEEEIMTNLIKYN
tara:strand:+ start:719 stop:2542 length:1824 start_codon:yes stop_codon:yes gene_type:complete